MWDAAEMTRTQQDSDLCMKTFFVFCFFVGGDPFLCSQKRRRTDGWINGWKGGKPVSKVAASRVEMCTAVSLSHGKNNCRKISLILMSCEQAIDLDIFDAKTVKTGH